MVFDKNGRPLKIGDHVKVDMIITNIGAVSVWARSVTPPSGVASSVAGVDCEYVASDMTLPTDPNPITKSTF